MNQWLDSWDSADFSAEAHRRRPQPHFYVLSLPATDLRRLADIYRREMTDGPSRASDTAIQRRHDKPRSSEIGQFVRHGFPWSTLSKARQQSGEFDDLIKPGWLPTGIVVNILQAGDVRRGAAVAEADLLEISETSSPNVFDLILPRGFGPEWSPSVVAPIEVIDGQHRLWAFDAEESSDDFEMPVVAFHGLDLGWQAYLFYTINIKPKKIDRSLGFDLYPLLRNADWLERAEEHSIYRESRAQEIVEILWSHPLSPWRNRIDMLGERRRREVSQAAWIRSLVASLIRPYAETAKRVGGLFGANSMDDGAVLAWTRTQQAAYVIYAWSALESAVGRTEADWAQALRSEADGEGDPAFAGAETLLNTDQGVRGFLRVVNDLPYLLASDLRLADWSLDLQDSTDDDAVSDAIRSLSSEPVGEFLQQICKLLADWDWRSSKSASLSESERQLKARFRGGTGYREIRSALFQHLEASSELQVSRAATEALELSS